MRTKTSLEQKIKQHRELYYKGTPEISDDAFDTLVLALQKKDPNSPVLTQVGAPVEFAKVKHNMVMGSLANAFNLDDIKAWMKRIDYYGPFIVEPKLDGSSIEVIYVNGNLSKAITRGDGIEGQDITQVIKKIPSVPHKIRTFGTVSLRGEVVFLKSKFIEFSKVHPGYKNRRNAVAGILHRKTLSDEPSYLTVMIFDVKIDDSETRKESCKLTWIENEILKSAKDFYMVDYTPALNIETIEKIYGAYLDTRESTMCDVDGMVIKIDDATSAERIGYDKLNPKFQIAYKLPAETAVVTVLDIKHSVTPSGRITPLIVTNEVFIDGATCGRSFSAHNWDWLKNKLASIGAKVIVSRHGSVIPQVDETIEYGTGEYNVPTECPNCKGPVETIGLFYSCKNKCLAHKAAVYGIIDALKIKQAGPSMLDKLIDAEFVKTPVDLFSLCLDDFKRLNMEGNGRKVIQQLKTYEPITLAKLLASVGIEGVGTRFQVLIDSGYDTIDKLLNLKSSDIERIDGFGSIIADMVVDGLHEKKDLIIKLLDVMKIKEETQTDNNNLQDIGVKFTGKMPQPRAEMEADAKSKGAVIKWTASLRNILVIADTTSQSSKAQMARKSGYEILTPSEWLEL